MYFISCAFKVDKNSPTIYGFAVCQTPDHPVTFIYPDGTSLIDGGNGVWSYNLDHFQPWAKIETGRL